MTPYPDASAGGRNPYGKELTLNGTLHSDRVILGYRTPKDAEEKRRPWVNARIEKALTGRYFRHMFREGPVIVPGGGWRMEGWKTKEAALVYHPEGWGFHGGPDEFQAVHPANRQKGFVIITYCDGGMVESG